MKVSQEERDHLPSSAFAVPGKRKLLIHDATHAKLAWDMVDRTDGLSDEERSQARRRIKAALKRHGVDTGGYEKSLRLDEAHEELEKHMAQEEKSRLSKSLQALRSHFGLSSGDEELDKSGKSVNETTPMKGDEGYPNDQGAAARISRARNKSKPAKDPEGHYEDLPDAENDTTSYENDEDDELDGKGGKKVTEKSMASIDEDHIYKSMVDGDPTGDVIEAINATDALELMASTMGKSTAHVSGQVAALGAQVDGLNKSMAVLAGALAEVMERLNEGSLAKSAAPATEGATEDEAPKAGEEEGVEKSMSADERKRQATLNLLKSMDEQNSPVYFSELSTGLQKSAAAVEITPESLNTPAGRHRVKKAVEGLVKSGKANPDLLMALDSRLPYEVFSALSGEQRKEAGLV